MFISYNQFFISKLEKSKMQEYLYFKNNSNKEVFNPCKKSCATKSESSNSVCSHLDHGPNTRKFAENFKAQYGSQLAHAIEYQRKMYADKAKSQVIESENDTMGVVQDDSAQSE